MPSEKNESPNKIKYSIWDTKTDEKQRKILEAPNLIKGFNRDSKKGL
ncbi:hypothetical protein AABM38_10465 [Heyndrickxia sp. MSNUG]